MAISLKPLDQQVVVVTGASSGIGLATVMELAQAGASIVLAARSELTLDATADRVRSQGGEAIAVRADVADREQVQRIADIAIQRFRRFDTWINNAAVSIYGRLEDVSIEDSRRLFDVNFWGVVYGSMAALPQLKAHGGALINVGSEVSEAVVPLQGMYSASKHAVKGFTDTLRIELEAEAAPVSLTLIQPTAVNTPFPRHARNYLDREPQLPSPQIDPQQVARAICDAACHPRRDVKVGAMAKINTFVANNIPRLGDRMARKYIDTQQQDSPPQRNPEGSLYHPFDSGQIYGEPPGV